MTKVRKYGKRSAEIITQKNSFFEENDRHLAVERSIAELYIGQPSRLECKNCGTLLPEGFDFVELETEYLFCDVCGHLNGRYQDSNAFCEQVYHGDEGERYGLNYSVADREAYFERMRSIYLPKADFLIDVLRGDAAASDTLSFTDFGAGSGYFVAALDTLGREVEGYEISAVQVDFANAMLDKTMLHSFEHRHTGEKIAQIRSEVLSMIGVLEHLQEPREVLAAIRDNDSIEYLYLSVPLFSFSVFFEMLSPEIFSRQLSGGHNHLYTERSLRYMCEEFGFESVGEWWFGSDMMDLYRHVAVMLQKRRASKKMREMWRESFGESIDELQLQLDKKHRSSEVHIVLKKVKV